MRRWSIGINNGKDFAAKDGELLGRDLDNVIQLNGVPLCVSIMGVSFPYTQMRFAGTCEIDLAMGARSIEHLFDFIIKDLRESDDV